MSSPIPSRLTICIPARSAPVGGSSADKENTPLIFCSPLRHLSNIFQGKVMMIMTYITRLTQVSFTDSPVKLSPRHPSEGWLNDPAWIGMWYIKTSLFRADDLLLDGSIDPPHFYYSRKEVIATLHAHGHEVPPNWAINHVHPSSSHNPTIPLPRALLMSAASSCNHSAPTGVDQLSASASTAAGSTSAGQGMEISFH